MSKLTVKSNVKSWKKAVFIVNTFEKCCRILFKEELFQKLVCVLNYQRLKKLVNCTKYLGFCSSIWDHNIHCTKYLWSLSSSFWLFWAH